MNYLKQMNAFLDRSSCEELSTEAQVLYIRLFGLFNKAVWKKSIKPNAQMLQGLTGLNDSAFARARQELANEGYIRFDYTATKSGCTYELIQLYSDDDVIDEPIEENKTEQKEQGIFDTDLSIEKEVKCERNEKEMKKKCERKPKYNIYNNNIYIKQNKTREKQNKPQAAEDISLNLDSIIIEKIELFKKSYPDKVNSNYLTYLKYKNILSNLDIQMIIKQIDKSDFLKNNKNLNLSWLLENHLKVINGCYANFLKPPERASVISGAAPLQTTRKYTQEELAELIDDISKVQF